MVNPGIEIRSQKVNVKLFNMELSLDMEFRFKYRIWEKDHYHSVLEMQLLAKTQMTIEPWHVISYKCGLSPASF